MKVEKIYKMIISNFSEDQLKKEVVSKNWRWEVDSIRFRFQFQQYIINK